MQALIENIQLKGLFNNMLLLFVVIVGGDGVNY